MNKSFLLGSAQLIGGIIGAGVFSLPFLLSKAGWVPFLVIMVIFGIAAIFIHLFFAEVVLRTEDIGTLPMYTKKYLNRPISTIVSVITVLGIGGALLVYIILGGVLLSIVLISWNIPPFHLSLFFILITSFLFLKKRKDFPSAEFFLTIFLLLIMLLIAGVAVPFIDWQEIPLFDGRFIFMLPGIILFSLIGWNTLPSINRGLKKAGQQKKIGRIIIWSLLIIMLSYLFFSLSFAGVGGDIYQWQDVIMLSSPQKGLLIALAALVGFLISVVSFLSLANYLKTSLINDFHFSSSTAFSLIVFGPLLLFLGGFDQITGLIGVIGTLMGAIEGIVIIALFRRAKKEGDRTPEYFLNVPRYLLYVLVVILVFGIGSQAVFYLL